MQAVDDILDSDAQPVRLQRSGLSPYLTMVTAGIMAALMVIAAGLTILHLQQRVEEGTKANLAQLALVLSEETSRSFRAVDLVMKETIEYLGISQLARAEVDVRLRRQKTQEYLARKLGGLPLANKILLVDAKGDLVNYSRSGPVPQISVADREVFQYLRNHDTTELFVSQPVRSKLDNGAWMFQLGRRINDADGMFLGLIIVPVRLDYFDAFYDAVALGEGGSISLLRDDGVMLVRYPFMESMIGQVHVPAKEGKKEFWGRGYDGLHRYVAFQKVPNFPVIVGTSMTSDAVIGSWRRDATLLLFGASGAVTGIVLLFVVLLKKIRLMKRSEAMLSEQNAELAQSRKLLIYAQRIGKVGHWIHDLSNGTSVWSEQSFEITGLRRGPVVEFDSLLELIHPDDVTRYIRVRTQAVKDKTPYSHEYRLFHSDGGMRWVRVEGHPHCDATGKAVSLFGIIQDITEQKTVEEAAAHSQSLLSDAVEALTEGFVLFDKDDRFVMSNTHYREMLPEWAALLQPGVAYEDLIRQACKLGLIELGGRDLETAVRDQMEWHYSGSKPIERRSKGRWIQAVDHRTSDGGTVGLRSDITAFKTIQLELEHKLADVQAIRADLEQQKRELEATSIDLRAARDSAEAANRAKSDFLAIMSHEIRTPLSGMVGMVDLLRGTPLNDEQQRYTMLAKESADLLLDVINDILDFSKLEAGRLTPECIDFDLHHLVEGVASVMGGKASTRGLELRTILPTELPRYLRGDPTRIRQVLLNLTANAVKFTEHGRIEISVSQHETADNGIELQIEVADSGIGMSAEVQAQVFDAFVQADTSISRKYGGSGLGLAICKQLCAMMGGAIGVESLPGQGSRFWFKVACGRGQPPATRSEPVVAAAGVGLEILVAEDSPIIATLVSSMLKKQGFRPTMVVDGAKAVAAVSEKLYDLVLMDVQMPEMDGISATKAIRALPGTVRDVPIIALTANALVGQRETYLAAGMNDYVTKPIQPPLLFAAINRWALRRAEAPPLQAAAEAVAPNTVAQTVG
jgi:PAS domain S-box-containing protein